MRLTSRHALHFAHVQLDSWNLAENEEGHLLISREWRAKSFVKALELCDRIAEVAEEEGHHPDLHITGGAVQEQWQVLGQKRARDAVISERLAIGSRQRVCQAI